MMKTLIKALIIIFPAVCFGQEKDRIDYFLRNIKPVEKGRESDLFLIKRTLRDALTTWLQKGEFEKTTAYETRIKNEFAQAFDSICFEVVWATIQELSAPKFELLKYNADTEKFGVSFELGDVSWRDSLSIPLNKAPEFKEAAQHIEILIDEKDWVFINNQLLPSKFSVITDRGLLTFRNPNGKERRISFTSSELGFSGINSKEVEFIYKDYYTKSERKPTQQNIWAKSNSSTVAEKIYEKVEIEASVNVGQWRRHLENQMTRYIEEAANAGMPPGNYTINVRFLVEKDGSIVDIKALNDPGYGLAKGAVEIVKRGPRWTPGEQNGRIIRSYHTQPITFQIQR